MTPLTTNIPATAPMLIGRNWVYPEDRNFTAVKYAVIARAMQLSSGEESTEAACMALVKELEQLNQRLHIPTLRDCSGVDRQKFEAVLEKMAQDALASGSPQNNPVVPTNQEIISLYETAW